MKIIETVGAALFIFGLIFAMNENTATFWVNVLGVAMAGVGVTILNRIDETEHDTARKNG